MDDLFEITSPGGPLNWKSRGLAPTERRIAGAGSRIAR
jgi:hypothetical protein